MTKKTKKEKAVKKANTDRKPCLCGCKGIPALKKSVFLPGHDMKLRGAFSRAAKRGGKTAKAAKAELKKRGWALKLQPSI